VFARGDLVVFAQREVEAVDVSNEVLDDVSDVIVGTNVVSLPQ